MTETPETGAGAGAAAAPAPTTPAGAPRGRRQQARQRRSRGVVLALVAIFGAAFTAVAVWLARSDAPYVTHREVMAIASAIEHAASLADLRDLVRADASAQPLSLPSGESVSDIASWIWLLKSKADYTYIGTREEQTERPRLLFRANAPTLLFDYQELRLARLESGVKVVDLWSMSFDRWFSDLQRERERIAEAAQGSQVAALNAAIASSDAPAAIAVYRALPDAVRASVLFAAQLLAAFPEDERVFTELRMQHHDSLAIGFHAVVRAQRDSFANRPVWMLAAALQALPTVDARTDDGQWYKSLDSALRRALGPK